MLSKSYDIKDETSFRIGLAMKIKSAEFKRSTDKLSSCPKELIPEVAFAGRSNVGKSSLMNRLLNRNSLVKVSATPGKTQTINFFLINGEFHFVDLPGYGFAKVPASIREQWKGMIEGYLTGREQLRGVVLLVDIRRTPLPQDIQMKEWLIYHKIPLLLVATKADKLSARARDLAIEEIRRAFDLENVLPFSSKSGEGKDLLWTAIGKFISREREKREEA